MTITNGSVEGGTGDLIADVTTGDLHWTGVDGARYWYDDTALFWRTTYKAMTYQVTVTPATATAGGKYLMFDDDFQHSVAGATLEYLAGGVFKMFPALGLAPIAETDEQDFRVKTPGGKIQGRISKFIMRIV